VETVTHPATTAESQITLTVTAPEQLERPSSTPLIPAAERTHALPSTPALSPIRAIEPAPALKETPAVAPATVLAQTPAIEPAQAVLPTETSPQPPRPAAPTTPPIQRIAVSRKYCKMVLFKYFEIIYLRHQLIIIVTNVRDEHSICVYQ